MNTPGFATPSHQVRTSVRSENRRCLFENDECYCIGPFSRTAELAEESSKVDINPKVNRATRRRYKPVRNSIVIQKLWIWNGKFSFSWPPEVKKNTLKAWHAFEPTFFCEVIPQMKFSELQIKFLKFSTKIWDRKNISKNLRKNSSCQNYNWKG